MGQILGWQALAWAITHNKKIKKGSFGIRVSHVGKGQRDFLLAK